MVVGECDSEMEDELDMAARVTSSSVSVSSRMEESESL